MQFQNWCNKVASKLRVVQILSEILWFQIELAQRALWLSIFKSRYRVWFQTKLHSTQFSYNIQHNVKATPVGFAFVVLCKFHSHFLFLFEFEFLKTATKVTVINSQFSSEHRVCGPTHTEKLKFLFSSELSKLWKLHTDISFDLPERNQ